MNKKLIALLLALAMLLALAACGGKNEEAPSQDDTAVEDTRQEQEPETAPETGTAEEGAEGGVVEDQEEAEQEEAEQEEAGPENLPAAPVEKPEVNNKPANPNEKPQSQPVQKPAEKPQAPEAEKPVETPETKPEETPEDSQSKPAPKADLTAFYENLVGGGEWPAMGAMEGEALDAFYPGLSAITRNQCMVYMPMMSAVAAEVALVEVENAADVQAVKDIFQARINYQVGDETNPGGAWYPETIEGWKNNSRIVSNGHFIMMVVHESADNAVTAFNALFA